MTHLLTWIDATLSQTVTQCVWTVTHFECFNNIISKFILNLRAKFSKYIWQNKTNIIQPIFITKQNNGRRSPSLKWGASSRWSTSLCCPMWKSDEMTIGKAHSTLKNPDRTIRKKEILSSNPLLMYSANVKDSENADR